MERIRIAGGLKVINESQSQHQREQLSKKLTFSSDPNLPEEASPQRSHPRPVLVLHVRTAFISRAGNIFTNLHSAALGLLIARGSGK